MNSFDREHHPLYKIIREPFFTPPIERAGNFLINAYQSGRHGMRLIGLTRYGKGYAVKFLRKNAGWRLVPMVFLDVRVSAPDRFTESYFFSMLSQAFKLRELHRSLSTHAINRVANHLSMLADQVGAELVVLAMDESQRLSGDDWRHVVTLDNALEALDKRIFLIFVQQLDVTGSEAEAIQEDVAPQVYERYTKPKFDFPGIVGPMEVRVCLSQFDEELFWPNGSGTSYTAHFAPEAFSRGWRLAQHAEQIHRIATEMRAENGLPTDEWQWRMVSLEALMVHLTLSLPARGPDFEGFTDAEVRAALVATFFVD